MGKNILSVSADAKTSKGEKRGYLTGILYFTPADGSGYEVCKYRTAGCTSACLATAGRGSFNSVQSARLAKTQKYFGDRSGFWSDLIWSIKALVRKAERENMTPCVRLNGTSDLPYERMPVKIDGERIASNIFELFPDVRFYDYTKYPNTDRSREGLPENYDLTFSYHEDCTIGDLLRELRTGRVAVVFDTPKGKSLPLVFGGAGVLDADDTDLRFLEPSGVICGLRAKGKARKDTSGFVQRARCS